eukprot:TRINITY_DN16179_c0_g1_i1.p1 TRINITY_DN16179_c0_g1~~TRINITY_DN16179_c0_g1_i1.p1  ORF type:complete len:508 (+),score=141.36 TRINITY_DN16179_c0_g1_i1:130-1653(+)
MAPAEPPAPAQGISARSDGGGGQDAQGVRRQVHSQLQSLQKKQQRKGKKQADGSGLRVRVAPTPCTPAGGAEEVHGQFQVPVSGRTDTRYKIGTEGMVAPHDSSWMPPHTARKTRHKHLHMMQAPSVRDPIHFMDLRIGGEAGKGAYGVVSRAVHRPSQTVFAIKKIAVQTPQCGERAQCVLKSIQRELERCCLPKNMSNYMVSSYEAYYVKGNLHILMEWMDFGSLKDVLEVLKMQRQLSSTSSIGSSEGITTPSIPASTIRECCALGETLGKMRPAEYCPADGRLSAHDLSVVAYHVLCGLSHLRELHQIHNDIKPGNILINAKGEIKIADFGVAQWTNSISMAPSGSLGDQLFMAPERIASEPHDYRADIWSLGLTIAHCAIGRYPFVGPTQFVLFQALARGDGIVRWPAELDAAPAMQSFVSDCMEPVPSRRQTAGQLKAHAFITQWPTPPGERQLSVLNELRMHCGQQPQQSADDTLKSTPETDHAASGDIEFDDDVARLSP